MNHRAETVTKAAHAAGGEVTEPEPATPRHAAGRTRYGYAPHIGPDALEESVYWAREATEAARHAQAIGPGDEYGTPDEFRREDLWLRRARSYAAVSVANSALARAAATAEILARGCPADDDAAADWDSATGRLSA